MNDIYSHHYNVRFTCLKEIATSGSNIEVLVQNTKPHIEKGILVSFSNIQKSKGNIKQLYDLDGAQKYNMSNKIDVFPSNMDIGANK